MADEAVAKEAEKVPVDGGAVAPAGQAPPAEGAPPTLMPALMPDLMAPGGGKKSWLRALTLPTWALALALCLACAAVWVTYRVAFNKGSKIYFKADLSSMKLKTPFSDPMYPILNLEANLRSSAEDQKSLEREMSDILRESKTMEWDPEDKNFKNLLRRVLAAVDAFLRHLNPKYVVLSLQMALTDEKGLSECAEKESQLRDSLIALLSSKSEEDLDSGADQNRLKRLIRDEMNVSLLKTQVKEVHFIQFRVKLLSREKKMIPLED